MSNFLSFILFTLNQEHLRNFISITIFFIIKHPVADRVVCCGWRDLSIMKWGILFSAKDTEDTDSFCMKWKMCSAASGISEYLSLYYEVHLIHSYSLFCRSNTMGGFLGILPSGRLTQAAAFTNVVVPLVTTPYAVISKTI